MNKTDRRTDRPTYQQHTNLSKTNQNYELRKKLTNILTEYQIK